MFPREVVAPLLGVFFLSIWIYVVVIEPLEEDARQMNLKQMDPTDIVLVPLKRSRALVYVGGVLIYAAIMRTGSFVDVLRPWATASVLLFGIMILAGVSSFEHLDYTVLSSIYLSTMLHATPHIFASRETFSYTASPVWEHIHITAKSKQAILIQYTSRLILFCSITSSILRIYDRGWQLQRIPVPIFLGGWIGHVLGLVLGYARCLLLEKVKTSHYL